MVVTMSGASCGAHRVFLTTTCPTARTSRISFALYSHDHHDVHHSGRFFRINSWLGRLIYLHLSSSTRATLTDPLPTWNPQLSNAMDTAFPASTRIDQLSHQDDVRATAGIIYYRTCRPRRDERSSRPRCLCLWRSLLILVLPT
jgi:hypothetical protein